MCVKEKYTCERRMYMCERNICVCERRMYVSERRMYVHESENFTEPKGASSNDMFNQKPTTQRNSNYNDVGCNFQS